MLTILVFGFCLVAELLQNLDSASDWDLQPRKVCDDGPLPCV